MDPIYSVISATGSYVPPRRVRNEDFLDHEFLGPDGSRLPKTNREVLEQFESITGIRERRYVSDDSVTSDIAWEAAKKALESSKTDPETLDYIILAHNFGDVRPGSRQSDQVPSLAARVKTRLGIESPHTVAFDLVFGCPGWIQGLILADFMIRSGGVKRALVIGAETLSRVSDPHDRDSLIYADGAGAVILESRESNRPIGILSHAVRSDTLRHSGMLTMGPSYRAEVCPGALFLKMEGRKLYKYAVQTVATAMKRCLDDVNVPVTSLSKILLHQANGKMDEAIVHAFYSLYGLEPPLHILPMTISWLGNSSVATIPTLFDLISRGELEGHAFHSGDLILLASVGAGMNVNAVLYRVPD